MNTNPENNAVNGTPYDNELLQASADTAVKQLDMLLRRGVGDDLNTRAVENARNSVTQFVSDVHQRLNYEADEYNDLMDIVDALHADKAQLDTVIANLTVFRDSHDKLVAESTHKLEDELGDVNTKLSKVTLELTQLQEQYNAETSRVKELSEGLIEKVRVEQQKLAAYMKANPESIRIDNDRLTKEVAKMRITRREDNKTRQDIQSALNKANGTIRRMSDEVAMLSKQCEKALEMYTDAQHRSQKLAQVVLRQSGMEGVTTHKTQHAQGHDVRCYVSDVFMQPTIRLHNMFTSRDCHYGFNRYWRVSTSMFIDLTVYASPWGRALIFGIKDLNDHWNPEITVDIEARIEKAMQEELPVCYKRTMDGKQAPISELKLPARVEKALVSSGYETVYDVGHLLGHEIDGIKGCGPSAKHEIVNGMVTWENQWEANNSPVEEYRYTEIMKLDDRPAVENREQRRKAKHKTK